MPQPAGFAGTYIDLVIFPHVSASSNSNFVVVVSFVIVVGYRFIGSGIADTPIII